MPKPRWPALVALMVLGALLVAACDGDGIPAPTATSSPSASPASRPTVTASPTVAATSTPAASTPTPTATATSTPTGSVFEIQVFFSRHPESGTDPSAVFPVDRMAPDAGVARYAIEQLLEGPTVEETNTELFSTWTEFEFGEDSDCDGEQFMIGLQEGVKTVRFCTTVVLVASVADGVDLNRRLGQAQSTLVATLEQFRTVDRVLILDRGGNCMFDLSGLNLCLEGN